MGGNRVVITGSATLKIVTLPRTEQWQLALPPPEYEVLQPSFVQFDPAEFHTLHLSGKYKTKIGACGYKM